MKLSFTIDIQFAKEVVIIYLDLVGVVEDELTDMLRISTYELTMEECIKRDRKCKDNSSIANYWSQCRGSKRVCIVEGTPDALKTVVLRSNDIKMYPIEMDNKLLFPETDKDVEKFIMQINMESLFKNVATVYNLLKNK